MVDILDTVHFNSVESFLLKNLKNDGDLTPPKFTEFIYPSLFWGLDEFQMRAELRQIMSTLKLLNVLSNYLYYRKDFKHILDDMITETMIVLAGNAAPIPLNQREAYNAMTVLISCIRGDVIKDKLRPLLPKETNALLFMLEIRNLLAHIILQREQDPHKYGKLY